MSSQSKNDAPTEHDAQAGEWSRAELFRMNSKFSATIEHAAEAPREPPDRVEPSRKPRAPRGFGTFRRELLPVPKCRRRSAKRARGEGKNFVNASRASLSFDLVIG
jgi:hypothetical protein